MAILPQEGLGAFQRNLTEWGIRWSYPPWPGDDAPWKLDSSRRVPILSFMGRLRENWDSDCGTSYSEPDLVGAETSLDLLKATLANDAGRMRSILEKLSPEDMTTALSWYDGDGFSLLHHACAMGHCEAAQVLLNAGIPAGVLSEGVSQWVTMFCPRDADIDPSETGLSIGITPMHLAARHGHVDILKLLSSLASPDVQLTSARAAPPSILTNNVVSEYEPKCMMPSSVKPAQLAAMEGQWEAAMLLVEKEARALVPVLFLSLDDIREVTEFVERHCDVPGRPAST